MDDMSLKPQFPNPIEHGNRASWWIEYPSGLFDLTRTRHVQENQESGASPPPLRPDTEFDLLVHGNRTIRISKSKSALIVIDMQNFFLHPDLRVHPKGLACVDPLLSILPILRSQGVKIIWVNWGLTDHELTTIPPALVRSFYRNGRGGSFGFRLPGNFGRLLMRGEPNADLYGPLQDEYLKGTKAGTDVWIHKNRMSALWGPETALNLYLQENGIETLLWSGVNTDQCVLGSLLDAYYKGYDSILVNDTTATASPAGAYENVAYNVHSHYGFTTDSSLISKLASGHGV